MGRLRAFSEAENQISNEVGRRIGHARKDRGILANELAKEVGVSPSTLCTYETGRTCCPLPVLVKISRRLVVPLIELLPSN
jgi:ribosome-binding protein aMBF1 (putative translation factor)